MRTLILFAHPNQRVASINRSMAEAAMRVEGVTFVDLYAEYPRFEINIDREQSRLREHDAIIFQFPVYWYSTPALLKEWQDLVLEYGFAYGPEGQALGGKFMMAVVTTGGREKDYKEGGGNNHSLRDLLLPLQQTAILCGMTFLSPFVLYGANDIDSERSIEHIAAYPSLLTSIRDDAFDLEGAALLGTFDRTHLPALVRL